MTLQGRTERGGGTCAATAHGNAERRGATTLRRGAGPLILQQPMPFENLLLRLGITLRPAPVRAGRGLSRPARSRAATADRASEPLPRTVTTRSGATGGRPARSRW